MSIGKETLKLYFRVSWNHKWYLLTNQIAEFFVVLTANVLVPLVIANIVQKLTEIESDNLTFDDFTPLIWQMVGLMAARFVVTRVAILSYYQLTPKAARDLELMCFDKLARHSQAFYSNSFTGALVAKVNRLSTGYERFMDSGVIELGNAIRLIIFYLIFLAFLAPTIALLMFIWAIIYVSLLIYLHRKKSKYSRAAAQGDTKVTAALADAITNMLNIRLFARERQERSRFETESEWKARAKTKNQYVSDAIRSFKAISTRILDVVITIVSIKLVLDGSMDVGTAVLAQIYLRILVGELWNVGRHLDRMEEALSNSAEMVRVLIEDEDIIDPKKPEKINMPKGAIEIKDAHFSYKDMSTNEQLFASLNVSIPSGQKVGLVGPSGGGKSTFTRLLLRLMDLQSGVITIDGQDITKVTQADLRKQVSYVPQEPLLFHRGVLENIRYGDPDASLGRVKTAAKQARASEFIDRLVDGYDTLVGERGVKLSGGQKQRVAIARAMLKKSPILILDEATSSLDSESERYITQALDDLMKDRTTIVIAHRLSTIRKMDRILVLEEGRIVEDGSHKELLKQDGLYAKLWSHQHGDFLD